jgi:hypothetical protein
MALKNLRREARVDACIQVIVVRGRKMEALQTTDVSFKGLFLRTSDPPPLRSLMRLRVLLPLREIEAHAMVVHVCTTNDPSEGRSPGVGVQFWGLAGPEQTAWDDFVRDVFQARRAAAKRALTEATPASTDDPPTPSGIHITGSNVASAPNQIATKK